MLEVADIFRDHGAAWRRANAGRVSLDQMKVMSAIERCRTAALGGHVARCEDCAHAVIAYNSCRNAIAREIGALTPALRRAFAHEGETRVPAVITRTLADAWAALDGGEYANAERLVQVAKFLISREGAKFRADPAAWLERQRMLTELAA